MKTCSSCGAGMSSHRVNTLCEECYAEELDSDYDSEIDSDDDGADGFNGTCRECGEALHPEDYEAEVCDDCQAKQETE